MNSLRRYRPNTRRRFAPFRVRRQIHGWLEKGQMSLHVVFLYTIADSASFTLHPFSLEVSFGPYTASPTGASKNGE